MSNIIGVANVRKSKSKWFLREAINVFGARSIFLASGKKEPVNIGIVANLFCENDCVDVLVQNEKDLVNYELLMKSFSVKDCDPSVQKIVGKDRDVIIETTHATHELPYLILAAPHASHELPAAVRVATHAPHELPLAARVATHAPHELPSNLCWQLMCRMSRLIAASTATTSQPVDVDEIDRSETSHLPSDSQGVPDYMVPDNTPVEDPVVDLQFPVTQSHKIQPLSAMTEVELNKDEKNRTRTGRSGGNWECAGKAPNNQIRACNKSFVLELKKQMQTNAYAHYHNFILLVDPQDCPDKSRWKFPPHSSWKFYVIGGNHSALARMEQLAQYPGIYKHFRLCNCIIYAGLTKSEAALFAHDDNFDAEVRRKYTFHQRVEYFHRQFMEAKQTGESMASLRKRLALETVNIAETDSKTTLSTLESTFQVAFRTGKLWEVQESIFRKWERRELKSMKAVGKGKKKDDGEMRQTWRRALQSVSDDRKMSILLRVDSGELALDQMTTECERCRTLDKDHSNKNAVNKALFGVDDQELDTGKRKRASRVKSLAQVLPSEFLDHIDMARSYKDAKEQGREAPQPQHEFKTFAKEGILKSVEWDVFLDAKTEVTRGHKHSTEVAPPQNDSDAAMNEVIVESEDDEAILFHRDDEDPAEGPVGEDENPEDAEETSDQAERQDDLVDVVPDSLTGGLGDAE
ncbi:hypothetical protein R1sor_022317 [Riccia sorocarpa]|uniref:Uncharacterized protein n=1 Tax=Riccia sorocarpa TaxID=122646 RepID=A0ABD3GNB2_9MARC